MPTAAPPEKRFKDALMPVRSMVENGAPVPHTIKCMGKKNTILLAERGHCLIQGLIVLCGYAAHWHLAIFKSSEGNGPIK